MLHHLILYFFIRFNNGLISIALIAIFSRLLSPEEYGRYMLAIAAVTVITTIGFQWLNIAISRFYFSYKTIPAVMKAAALDSYWKIVWILAILYCISILFLDRFGIGFLFATAVFFISVIQGRYDMYLHITNAQYAPVKYGKLSLSKNLCILLFGTLFVYLGSASTGLLWGIVISLFIAVFIYDPMKYIVSSNNEQAVNKLAFKLFHYGSPLAIMFLSIVIVDLFDRFMIGWMLGSSYVAFYSAPYEVVQLLVGMVMNVVFVSIFPHIVKEFETKNDILMREHLTKLHGLLVMIGLGMFITIFMLSNDIAALIFGEKIRKNAIEVMPVIALSIVLATYKSYYVDVAFQLAKNTFIQGKIAIVMALTNLGLNVLLIPKYGIIGAGWATLISFGIGTVMSMYFGRKHFQLPLLGIKDILNIIVSCCLLIAFLYFSVAYTGIVALFVKVALGSGLYLFSFWMMDYLKIRSARWHV